MYNEIVNSKIAEFMKSQAKYKESKDVENATLAGEMVDLWRAIKAEFLRYEKEKSGNKITNDVEFKIISKMLQQRKEDIEEYGMAGRVEKVKTLQHEYDALSAMLPKEPSEAELIEAIDDYIGANGGIEQMSMAKMKDVQAYVKQKYAMANGGKIAQIFKNKLN